MKLMLTGDWHLRRKNTRNRIDNMHEAQKKKVEFIIKKAIEYNCDAIIQPGDMFDSPRPGYGFISEYGNLLFSKLGITVLSIFGQHDTYLRSEKSKGATALGILRNTKTVDILGAEPWTEYDGSTVDVYGASFGDEIPEIKDSSAFNVLVIHKMIVQEKLYDQQVEHTFAKRFIRSNNFDLIVCGDNHQCFSVKASDRLLVNAGCILRKNIDERDNQPRIMFYNTETREHEWIDIPVEKDVFVEVDNSKEEQKEMLVDFIEKLQGSTSNTVDLVANLQKAIGEQEVEEQVINVLSEVLDITL